MALVVVALVGWVVWSPPDFVRSLYADDSPADVHGDPVPAIADPPAARLAVIGDSGTGGRGQEQIADQLAAQHGDLRFNGLVILGDMIYPDGDADLVDGRILEPYEPLLGDGVELVPVLGNHDYESDEEDEVLDALGRDDSWYVEQVGPVRIIVLDSMQVDEDAQTQWLAKVLDEPQPPHGWTLVAMHHPPYSAGYHGSSMDVRDAWSPLFATADVPLALAGHDHDYQRSEPQDGVTYVVSGAGAKLRKTGTEGFTEVSTSTLHLLDLLVYDDRLVGRAIDASGRLVDHFTLTR